MRWFDTFSLCLFLLFVETGYSGGEQPATTFTNTMARGRPGRKPANRLQKSFLIEKGVKGPQLKKELILGGRVNVSDLHGGLWLNPSVVLKRLTVTIGGFKIELLPGPSYTQTVDTSQAACFDDGISYAGDIGFAVLPGEAVAVQCPVPEKAAEMDAVEKSSTDDAALGLSPYVNPNDVQTSNGALVGSPTQETKPDNQSGSGKQKSDDKGKDDIKQPQSNEDKKTIVSETDDKEKQQIVAKNLLKPKPGLTANKNKDLVSCKPSNMTKEQKVSQTMLSKTIQRGDLHKVKSLKEKKDIAPLKRLAENTQSEHATKVQKIQGTGDGKMKSKLPSSPSSLVKKNPSCSNRIGDQQAPAKQTPPQNNSAKPLPVQPAHSQPSHTLKLPEEGGQEKAKLKKPEKILQRQKSKSTRSISVEEPQLFIPDNAPVVKKETAEEQPANSDATWDGNNCCGLCKKHHNNT